MIPLTPWEEFRTRWPDVFRQGQHVTVIGPTGCGKSTLAGALIEPRAWVAAIGTKPRDSTLTALGWPRLKTWPPESMDTRRCIFWPTITKASDQATQRVAIGRMLEQVYTAGGWTVWIDELRYLTDHLRLSRIVTLLYTQARALDVSLVGCTQRPAWVPLEAYSQAGHLFLFRTGDERDLSRVGSLNGANPKEVAAIVSNLPEHEWLHVDLTRGTLTRSRLPAPKKKG